jgi:hypothetical protein
MSIESPTEHIEFAIVNNFLGLDELVTMSMVNKNYNQLAKREIKNIYKIIEIIRTSKIKVNNSSLYSNHIYSGHYDYEQNYWYELFGRKLNHQELAIYYAYFITKYNIAGVNWSCVAFHDGFIKRLGSRNDGSVSFSYSRPELYIKFSDYHDERLSIRTERLHLIELNPTFIDKKLLKKCIKYIFQNIQYTQSPHIRSIKPTINEAIENLYPIFTSL